MSEFKINDNITLKLEDQETVIYFNGEKFIQCKGILLNRTINELNSVLIKNSIDELMDEFDVELDMEIVSPETEFLVHCSNLQVWSENGYNTELLHSNLAFPLLQKLSEVGDVLASQKFKEEIMRRLGSGAENTVKYLVEEKYINYLDRDQFWLSALEPEEAEAIIKLEEKFDHHFIIDFDMDYWEYEKLVLSFKNKRVIKLQIFGSQLSEIPEEIRWLKSIRILYLCENEFKKIPDWICNLRQLEVLDVSCCELEYITEEIGCLVSLKKLELSWNHIEKIPESIGKLENLEICKIGYNVIEYLPESMGELTNLRELYLNSNSLKNIPQTLYHLKKLKKLELIGNNLRIETKMKLS